MINLIQDGNNRTACTIDGFTQLRIRGSRVTDFLTKTMENAKKLEGVRIVYSLDVEQDFDSAHFLAGYQGKCGNIHGHRWRVILTIKGEELENNIQNRGMLVDFSKLKDDLKHEVDYFDHSLIVEKDSLKETTMNALLEEGFKVIQLEFRPTAENLSKYFYDMMGRYGYRVAHVTVYETPNNCATYTEE